MYKAPFNLGNHLNDNAFNKSKFKHIITLPYHVLDDSIKQIKLYKISKI